jgi:hypothetical protein
MTEFHFEAEISGFGRVAELGRVAARADAAVWSDAARVLQRTYGDVRVRAEWPSWVADEPSLRFPVHVSWDMDALDVVSYASLYFHDAFLICNIAAPGSFGGVISIAGEPEFPLYARLFEYGWNAARMSIAPLPLADVARWYDSLDVGTRQVPENGVEMALFHLLHLARAEDVDEMSMLRLARTIDALGLPPMEIAHDDVVHPLQDDSLDERVETIALQWVDAADAAMGRIIAELQRRVRER